MVRHGVRAVGRAENGSDAGNDRDRGDRQSYCRFERRQRHLVQRRLMQRGPASVQKNECGQRYCQPGDGHRRAPQQMERAEGLGKQNRDDAKQDQGSQQEIAQSSFYCQAAARLLPRSTSSALRPLAGRWFQSRVSIRY